MHPVFHHEVRAVLKKIQGVAMLARATEGETFQKMQMTVLSKSAESGTRALNIEH